MTKKKATHADADLILKLYDLRREAVMRASRMAIVAWKPSSIDDVKALMQMDHPDNAAWRQVSSYFEMAWGFGRHGIIDADLLAENTGEGLLLYAKIEPFLKALRKEVSPTMFKNGEWLVSKSKSAAARLELFRKRLG